MNKIGKIFIFSGVLLVIISIFLFVRNSYEEYDAGKKSLEVVSNIKDIIDNSNIIDDNVVGSDNVKKMLSTSINNYDYIGVISIPSLNLELPVMNNYSEDRLRIAPVRYYGSIYTNDLIICAHSYKTHFGYLGKLQQGDKVIFTDISGNVYVYEVLEIEVLDSSDVVNMINNDFDLTLYTCTSDGSKRITVRCNKINGDINI